MRFIIWIFYTFVFCFQSNSLLAGGGDRFVGLMRMSLHPWTMDGSHFEWLKEHFPKTNPKLLENLLRYPGKRVVLSGVSLKDNQKLKIAFSESELSPEEFDSLKNGCKCHGPLVCADGFKFSVEIIRAMHPEKQFHAEGVGSISLLPNGEIVIIPPTTEGSQLGPLLKGFESLPL